MMNNMLFICLLFFTTLLSSNAQAPADKMQKASRDDWQLMLTKVNAKVPENLPDMALDPKCPQNTFLKDGARKWNDSTGNTYSRSVCGNWSNYSEAARQLQTARSAGSEKRHWDYICKKCNCQK